ncbi:MAG: stage II sporulation protein M [Lachnospiraceae bacterium]|nr:stage II sporulation protein M [Lachnospiraceae bacterium]
MYQQEKRKIYSRWFYLFLFGFLAGVLLMNLGSTGSLKEEGIFSTTVINRIQHLEVNSGNFLKYEFPQRIKLFLILILFSTTYFGIWAAYLCITWHGILAGMIITAAIIRFGLKGILLIMAGIFPQHLLFIPAIMMMLCWCYQTCSFLYFQEKSIWPFYQNKKRQIIHQIGMLFWIICIVVIGCILECYVNPILLSDIAQIF